jgi:hypothetical protein
LGYFRTCDDILDSILACIRSNMKSDNRYQYRCIRAIWIIFPIWQHDEGEQIKEEAKD